MREMASAAVRVRAARSRIRGGAVVQEGALVMIRDPELTNVEVYDRLQERFDVGCTVDTWLTAKVFKARQLAGQEPRTGRRRSA